MIKIIIEKGEKGESLITKFKVRNELRKLKAKEEKDRIHQLAEKALKEESKTK